MKLQFSFDEGALLSETLNELYRLDFVGKMAFCKGRKPPRDFTNAEKHIKYYFYIISGFHAII